MRTRLYFAIIRFAEKMKLAHIWSYINANDMECICVDCESPAALGKQYLREKRLVLAVKYCKKFDDCLIYADVCDKGIQKINA